MQIDSDLIGNFLLAVALVATTLASKWSTESRAQKKELNRLRQGNELRDSHIYDLRTTLAQHGIPRPASPKGLYDDPEPETSVKENG